MSDNLVELQGSAFDALEDLCGSLTPDQWAAPTECPGWSVADNLSHIVGTESMLLGRPQPSHDPGAKPWIRNPAGANNEIPVDYRRSWPPERVLDEFREVTAERMKILRAMSDDELGAESWTPIGPGTVRDLVAIRTMDCWVHEQDIRRAIGEPGNLDGPVARHAHSRHASAIPFVVGKKAAAPDGTTVVIAVDGFDPIAVGVDAKRANMLDAIPAAPTVTLAMDLETFNRLCCGRGDNAGVGRAVMIAGDQDIGARIVAQMNFMI